MPGVHDRLLLAGFMLRRVSVSADCALRPGRVGSDQGAGVTARGLAARWFASMPGVHQSGGRWPEALPRPVMSPARSAE